MDELDLWREKEKFQHYEKPCIPKKKNVLGQNP